MKALILALFISLPSLVLAEPDSPFHNSLPPGYESLLNAESQRKNDALTEALTRRLQQQNFDYSMGSILRPSESSPYTVAPDLSALVDSARRAPAWQIVPNDQSAGRGMKW